MRFSQHISLVILALVASCGPVSTSQTDTGVGRKTRGQEASPVVEISGGKATAEIPVAPKLVGFAAGSRFVVFENGDHAIVVDTSLPENAPHHVFDIDGRPITTTTDGAAYDHWMQAGLSSAHLAHRLVASDKGTLLVKTAEGVEAVDLLNRGALVARVKMENPADLKSASISPDGVMFGVWTSSSLQLVRSEDEDTSTYALHLEDPHAEFDVSWNASGDVVMWSDATQAHIVSRSSFDSALRISTMTSPKINVSKDGKTFVISSSPDIEGAINRAAPEHPGVVEVWHLGEDKPRAHVASAFVGQTLVSDDGHRVAWTEYSGDPTKTMQLHSLDLETGVHARFPSAGECGHYEERLVAFEGGASLKTDAECSPGCPSFAQQSHFISYDFASGRVIKKWLGERNVPYNDTLSSQISTVEDLAKKLHFERSDGQAPLVHHPRKSSALFVDPQKDITLVTESAGHTIAKLEDSTGFHASDVHFSPDGARIIGVSDEGYIAIWRTEDGHRIWSRR